MDISTHYSEFLFTCNRQSVYSFLTAGVATGAAEGDGAVLDFCTSLSLAN